jgi:hypothetical protein
MTQSTISNPLNDTKQHKVIRVSGALYSQLQEIAGRGYLSPQAHALVAIDEYVQRMKKHAPKPDATPAPAPKPKPKSSDWTIKQIQDSYQKDFAAQAKQTAPQVFYDDPNDIPEDYVYEDDTPT